MSLYDRLGQHAGISTAVDHFYERLLTTVSGGPQASTGRTMHLAHRRLRDQVAAVLVAQREHSVSVAATG